MIIPHPQGGGLGLWWHWAVTLGNENEKPDVGLRPHLSECVFTSIYSQTLWLLCLVFSALCVAFKVAFFRLYLHLFMRKHFDFCVFSVVRCVCHFVLHLSVLKSIYAQAHAHLGLCV